MTIESDAGFIPGPAPARKNDHSHDHSHDAVRADDSGVSRGTFSPFLASALDRLGLAVMCAGLVWIGVFWAVR